MLEKFTVELIEDPETKDLILPLPDQFMTQYGWLIDDVLHFEQSGSSFIIHNTSLQKRQAIVHSVIEND